MSEYEVDARYCAVCALPLDQAGEEQYLHVQPVDGDHVPVPVKAEDLYAVVHRCDFCNAQPVTSVVRAHSFDWPVAEVPAAMVTLGASRPRAMTRSIGNWAACGGCEDLVGARRWAKLARRADLSLPSQWQSEQSRIMLRAVYARLEAHIIDVISVQEWEGLIP